MVNTSINPKYQDKVTENFLEIVTQKTFDYLNEDHIDVSIVIETDQFIADLNRQYRGIDSPTDVLSFDIEHVDPETERRYLGDVLISIQTAERQSKKRKVSLTDELRVLIVHGLLHLLGYDHASPSDEALMWEKQKAILMSLGNSPESIPR